jgi:hypothetical protein
MGPDLFTDAGDHGLLRLPRLGSQAQVIQA